MIIFEIEFCINRLSYNRSIIYWNDYIFKEYFILCKSLQNISSNSLAKEPIFLVCDSSRNKFNSSKNNCFFLFNFSLSVDSSLFETRKFVFSYATALHCRVTNQCLCYTLFPLSYIVSFESFDEIRSIVCNCLHYFISCYTGHCMNFMQ